MWMPQRRRVASTSRLLSWWPGAGALEAWGSSSARTDTSHTVTGRPPSAMLACRRISRLPSTKVSGPLTEAPPVRTGIHEGGRALTYVISGRLRQATAGVRAPLAGRRCVTYSSRMPANPPATARPVSRTAVEGPRERERIRTLVVPDHDDLAALLAERFVETVRREVAAKGRCVVGLATGSTPLGIYRELIRRHRAGEVDFASVTTFNLDEYYPMPPDSPHSYRRYMWENFFAHVNIKPESVHIPDGSTPRERLAEQCAAYEQAIVQAGGIDFQLLGIGKSGHIGKAVLKLTARDYSENHLSPLLAKYGAPGPVNGIVFNRLRDKIRGRRKLPSRQRILVFSPHPDDDVISMGGILRKLWENENAIVVAYMTSGNIAVFDHDVQRQLDFVERAAEALGIDRAAVRRVRDAVEASFGGKGPGGIDLPVVQDLKQMIREAEAISALESVGLPRGAARFLNLPFYRTGEVRKRPIGDEDVALVRALLEEVRPDLVFVAGDLSDPHGTHRICKAAAQRALEGYTATRPQVWLYRGAWQEWPITQADVLVPLSQDELRAKIFAIFKHQSQKDTAPFPGGHDDREFWQRVEARNIETAARADRLGLPEYFAMEAYVVDRDGPPGR